MDMNENARLAAREGSNMARGKKEKGSASESPSIQMPSVWFYNKGIREDFFKKMDEHGRSALEKVLLSLSDEESLRSLAKRMLDQAQGKLSELKSQAIGNVRFEKHVNKLIKSLEQKAASEDAAKKLGDSLAWMLKQPSDDRAEPKDQAKDDSFKKRQGALCESWKRDFWKEIANGKQDADKAIEGAATLVIRRACLKMQSIWDSGMLSLEDKDSIANEVANSIMKEGKPGRLDAESEAYKISRVCLSNDYRAAKASKNRNSYCQDNHCIALGWSYTADDPETFEKICEGVSGSPKERQEELQRNLLAQLIKHKDESTVVRLAGNFMGESAKSELSKSSKNDPENCMSVGDYVWMRCDGEYYYAQIGNKARYEFVTDVAARCYDSCNQLKGTGNNSDIKWIYAGTEDEVPGSICMRHMGTILKIGSKKPSEGGFENFLTAITFSILNQAEGQNGSHSLKDQASRIRQWIIDAGRTDILKEETFFYKLLGPDGVEDLLAMWLYDGLPESDDKNGYKNGPGKFACIPSTSKHSTQAYEYVLLNMDEASDASRRCFPQVKNCTIEELGENGRSKVIEDLRKLKADCPDDTVMLFVSRSPHEAIAEEMKAISEDVVLLGSEFASELYRFACKAENRNRIPKKVLRWVDWIETLSSIGFFEPSTLRSSSTLR